MFLLFYSFDYPVGKLSHNLFEDGTIDPYCFDLIEALFTVKHFCKNIILNFQKSYSTQTEDIISGFI